jgi:hypothetical protein
MGGKRDHASRWQRSFPIDLVAEHTRIVMYVAV